MKPEKASKKSKREILYDSVIPPFIVEKDIDYYPGIQSKLNNLKDMLVAYNAPKEIIKTTVAFRETLLDIMRNYYKGNIALAQKMMINQIRTISNNDEDAINALNNRYLFTEDGEGVIFYRGRLDADEDGFKKKEMGVIPFNLRTKVSTERFSMPGLPCLYLGNTSYVCWLEMGKPADHRFNVSPVRLDHSQKVFDLIVNAMDLLDQNRVNLSKEISVGLIKRVMLSICSSFKVKEQNRHFKSEYIIPQLIMLACQSIGLSGVAYVSSKVSNSVHYRACVINVALYSRYPGNRFNIAATKSELDDHVEIGDAYNYAIYKQLEHKEASWRDDRSGRGIEILGQVREYWDTSFCHFDDFIKSNWK